MRHWRGQWEGIKRQKFNNSTTVHSRESKNTTLRNE